MIKSKAKQLHYGPVKIIKGKYKGKYGYYDDDAGYTDKAIVYLGSFFEDYVEIKYDYLVNTNILTTGWQEYLLMK